MYISKRFIDKFQPGDEVPADAYPAEDLAKMLVSGHIVKVDGKEPELPPTPLEEMTDSGLKDLAKELGVKGYSRMKRETLLQRIPEAQAEAEAENE